MNVARTGLTEAEAQKNGYDAVSVVTVVDDKAHYYPGASSFIVKMIADRKTLKLLGIQVIGTGAVDKMADIAVTAITMGATLHDVEDMDLAYAPPFSTAIHPFTHTVNVLLNKISGVDVPNAIEEIRTAPVLHDTVCEVEEMPQVVKKFLGV